MEDIATVVESKQLRVDMAFVTGDLALSGSSQEYVAVREFLNRLSVAACVPLERVFCVPGNHDVDRSRITPFVASAPLLFD
jgi:3',5'-cyclic AMP phosphodiesterase CpdA